MINNKPLTRKEIQARYRAKHPEKVRALSKAWKIKNKVKISNQHKKKYIENREHHLERHKVWRDNNKEYIKHTKLIQKYGIDLDTYKEILEKQNWSCVICKMKLTMTGNRGNEGVGCVDHDHKYNIVRGILCRTCNLMIGQAKDQYEILEAAAQYLRSNLNIHKEQPVLEDV